MTHIDSELAKRATVIRIEVEVSRAPATVDRAANVAEEARRRMPAEARPKGIALRRFAGPVEHTEKLEHLRVAHLTDLHVGRVTPMRVQHAAVDLTNAEQPDLVVITGDFVCHSQLYLDELEEVIGRFEAPVVGVLGNHDLLVGRGRGATSASPGRRRGARQRGTTSSRCGTSPCSSSVSTTRTRVTRRASAR